MLISTKPARALLFLAALSLMCAGAAFGDVAKGPYLADVSQAGVTVCWVSTSPEKGTVRWRAAGSTESWSAVREKRPTEYHRVKVRGLLPHAAYAYEVESGEGRQSGSFVAAPTPQEAFRFVAYGDNRTQAEVHASVVARIVSFRPDFVLNSGDQVANGADESMWAVFFRTAEPMLRDAPYYPELGNHEGAASPYFRYFGPARYYSFDYGDAHVTALDTNLTGAEWDRQVKWLKRDLAAHQGATWRVLFMHHPLYTCTTVAGRRESSAALRARLEPILKANRVQLVVSGHDHNYQRHEAGGITYLISGGGGAPLYDLRADTPNVKVAVKSYHDCEFTVSGPTMDCRVVAPDGKVIDTFTLTAR